MAEKRYAWADYIPLTSRDAKEAIRKGVQVSCLFPNGKVKPVTSEAEVRKCAKQGGALIANRHKLKQAITTYSMDYRICEPISGPAKRMEFPENGIKLTKKSADRFEFFDHGQANLSELAKRHGCVDGDYWAEYSEYAAVFGKEKCISYDEGVITIKNGEVIKVPDNFWLPF
jgi:hypothetical protein